MRKRILPTIVLFLLVAVLVFFAAQALDGQSVALPQAIGAETPCPVAGCTQPDGACHAAAAAPVPDGSFEMVCPRVAGCADVNCHAWDRIESGTMRDKPSDISMNLWIIAPVILVLALVALVRKF
ncbi:MAG: hypothetical protein LBP28_08600 [Coriobacteriales bacterium]|jgi:hypothetical protein|nr:hypothetical protein [Coriobacteriales bacterium]